MGSRLKVVELLSRDELDQLEAFARERSRTVDELHTWLQAHGFTLNRSAVYSWRVKFDSDVMAERFSRSGELARAIKGAIDKSSLEDTAEGAANILTQVVFEASAAMQMEGDVDSRDVRRWAASLRDLVGTKADAGELRAQHAQAVSEADKLAKAGASGEVVATRMREILGIKEAA